MIRYLSTRCAHRAGAAALAVSLAVLLFAAKPALAAKPDPALALAAAQAKIDAGDPAAALKLLDPLVKREPKLARGYLLRATARLMLGEDRGKEDLDKAVALDPTLRQAWLDRAAVAVAEKRYDAALADFEKARALDPGDADGILNIGAVQLLLGRLDEATRSFQDYLGQRPGDGAAYYLVAKNYALTGYAGLAVQNLQQAIALDERMRATARGDANFADLTSNPRFQELLRADTYRVPADALRAERVYPASYGAGKGPLLLATMDALQALGESFDPRVEVTPEWALLWSSMRIRVSDDAKGQGQVALTAPAAAMSAGEWKQRSTRLLDAILVQLGKRRVIGGPVKPGGSNR
ncbi:MAG TPA: tetratricopeptide repeat protein [Thermoanaerobaculia bacterium]|nr:tetratricopeptide repeat protein [Thermoanaerobaculia bacterium]